MTTIVLERSDFKDSDRQFFNEILEMLDVSAGSHDEISHVELKVSRMFGRGISNNIKIMLDIVKLYGYFIRS